MKRLRTIIITASVLLTFINATAQVNVSASMDSTSILIGEQTPIHLEVTQDAGETVQFPLLNDTIMKGVEILNVTPLDTTKLDGNRITVRQDILVTSFDSALYYMPPFRFVAGRDTLESKSMALKVSTYEVDTQKKEFYDIKPIVSAPFVWMDYYWEVLGVLIFLFVIVWSLYFYKRWKYRKDHPELIEPVKPALPPFEAAILALNTLKEKKLWQQGFEKEYYTNLTEILRTYIYGRYHVSAMEKTSAEILDEMRLTDVPKEAMKDLKSILEIADFVKFAKLRPSYDDNEMSFARAQSFVTQTKEEEKPEESETQETTVPTDKAN